MKYLAILFFSIFLLSCYSESEEELFPVPPPISDSTLVSFVKDIAPIINTSCSGQGNCHATGGIAGIVLETYNEIKASVNNPTIDNSLMHRIITLRNGPKLMPQGGPPLPENQRNLIKAWIDRGAKNN